MCGVLCCFFVVVCFNCVCFVMVVVVWVCFFWFVVVGDEVCFLIGLWGCGLDCV